MTEDPRNRVVFFRVTQEEYSKLQEVSKRNGARNLSDFVRSEILAYIHSGTVVEHLHRHFEALEQRIEELQSTTVSLLQEKLTGGSQGQP
jgi:cell fate (sporulation/competence/biofilm development) regulator YlbF (YheA/YmcA/DUF963 family)